MHSETNLQLIEILEKTISPDKNELETAEKYLEHAASTNLGTFIKMLSEVLLQGGNSQVARMAAGLQLKNHLTAKDADTKIQYQQRWLSLREDVRFYIKKNILGAIGSENNRPSSAAQCVAYVAVAELPVGQWNDVITNLVDNVVNLQSTEMQKEASLEAIGYICQDIDSEVLVEQCNQILTAIIHGMRSSEPSNNVRFAATMALFNSLEFTKANFDKENERNFIMEVVCEATQSPDRRISVAALQCLVKILSLYYQFMEPYMAQALFPITLEAMKSEEDAVALQGIEFWSNVSDEEIDLAIEESEAMHAGRPPVRTSRHYARGALQFLTPVLMHKLTKQEDSDEWNPTKAASVCIMLLANCCEDEILPYVLPFIDENIKSDNWRNRDAAIMTFGSIIGGLAAETMKPLVEQAMPTLIKFMYDSNDRIRDTIAWSLGRICELCPETALNETYFKPLLDCLVNGLSAEPSVAASVCWVFTGLAEAAYEVAKFNYETDTPETYQMSEYFNFIIQRLLQNTDRPDALQHNLRSAAYEALMEMLKHSPQDCYTTVQQTTIIILERLDHLLQMEKHVRGHTEISQYNDLQSLLCATLQSVLKKVTTEDAPKISDSIMSAMMTIFSSSSGKAGGIQEDAIMTVSGLVECLQENFIKYMNVFKVYLFMGLKNHQDYQVCEATVGLISDICRALKRKILPYCDELMTLLLENLHDINIHQSVKPPIFSAFGDIAMTIGTDFQKYLPVVMDVLLQASRVPMDRSDLDKIGHLNKLRESILEAYTGIVQGYKGDGAEMRMDIMALEHYVQDMLNFISMVAADPEHTENQVAAVVGLVGDLCAFGTPVLPLLEVKPIAEILAASRRSQVTRIKQNATWATKEMRRLKTSTLQAATSW